MSITVVVLVTLVGTEVSEEFLQYVYSLWQLQLAGHDDTAASSARTMATIIRNSDIILACELETSYMSTDDNCDTGTGIDHSVEQWARAGVGNLLSRKSRKLQFTKFQSF
jgi:hypothetical protein